MALGEATCWCHEFSHRKCMDLVALDSLRYMQLQRESQFNRQGLTLKGVGFEIRGRREVGVCTSLTL